MAPLGAVVVAPVLLLPAVLVVAVPTSHGGRNGPQDVHTASCSSTPVIPVYS
jgi:hypothetical protein